MTKRALVKDGRLTVSLFHGTSSLFYDSILSSGLGGRNVIEDMGIRKAARLLLTLCVEYRQEPDWLGDIDACDRIAEDPAKNLMRDGFGFSFRYGGTYLSACRETAANYAFIYERGGEALTYVLRLHQMLLAIRPDAVAREEFAPLVAFASRQGKPLLVEAQDVEISSICAERGGSTDEIIASMEDAFEDPETYELLVGQHNFELIRPIPSAQLQFHSIQKVLEFDENGASREVLQISRFEVPSAGKATGAQLAKTQKGRSIHTRMRPR